MSYLAFLFATGLLQLLGGGGPLHQDGWFRTLQRRVDATEPPFWLGLVLLIVLPCVVIGLLWGFAENVLGSLGALLAGVAMLLFAFGRGDYATLTQRVIARARSGDEEGAALILEEAGCDVAADSREAFARLAARELLYDGFQRWFPPAFYFLVLGPLWAVAYRLIQLAAADRRVPVGSLRHLIDWVPSRLLLFTFAVFGDFERCWQQVGKRGMDPEIATDELLLEGIEAALGGGAKGSVDEGVSGGQSANEDDVNTPANAVERVTRALTRSMVAWLIVASLIALL